MSRMDLSLFILEEIAEGSVQHSGSSAESDAACSPDSSPCPAASTPTIRTSVVVLEGVKNSYRIRAAAYARDHM
jgi:hypothetical protein